MRKTAWFFLVLTCIALMVDTAVAGQIKDAFQGGLLLKLIAGGLGLSVVALLGVIGKTRKAVEEIMDVVVLVKKLIKKYRDEARGGTIAHDLNKLKIEVDQALDSIADVLDRLKFRAARRLAKRLRDAL